jgi:LPS-assembly lipoprotein
MRTLLILTALLLTACGFHLRGQAGMPFSTLYIDAVNPGTALVADLRRNLEANKVKLVNAADQADVVLNITNEVSDKQVLTLGGTGRVTEYELRYLVSLRAYDLKGHEWMPAEEMMLRRNYIYDDTKVLAKEAEEAILYKSMSSDMVQQIVRRLSRAKPKLQ